jgi:hypothetical protein
MMITSIKIGAALVIKHLLKKLLRAKWATMGETVKWVLSLSRF